MIAFNHHCFKYPKIFAIADIPNWTSGVQQHYGFGAEFGDNIYWSPDAQRKITKFNRVTYTVTQINQNRSLPGSNKTFCTGAYLADQGYIFMPSYGANSWIALDPLTDAVSYFGTSANTAQVGHYKKANGDWMFTATNNFIWFEAGTKTVHKRSAGDAIYDCGPGIDDNTVISHGRFNGRFKELKWGGSISSFGPTRKSLTIGFVPDGRGNLWFDHTYPVLDGGYVEVSTKTVHVVGERTCIYYAHAENHIKHCIFSAALPSVRLIYTLNQQPKQFDVKTNSKFPASGASNPCMSADGNMYVSARISGKIGIVVDIDFLLEEGYAS